MKWAALLALAAVLTACTGGGEREPAEREPAAQPPALAPAMPLPDNAVAGAVARLDGIAADLMSSSGIPGLAVAVVHGGKTLYAKGFGVRDTRSDEPVDAGTVFQLASLSKPIAATVVAQQVGAGVITWDTPVVDTLPWFALSDPSVTRMVTVGDFFAHRSGLPDHAGDVLEDLGYDRRAVLERMRLLPLAPFRTSYAYTNFGVTAAAEAVATAAGRDWADLSEQVLYRPLGMSTASSRFADFQSRPDRAVGHVKVDGAYQPRYTRDPDAQSPAGGVSASVQDMASWLAMCRVRQSCWPWLLARYMRFPAVVPITAHRLAKDCAWAMTSAAPGITPVLACAPVRRCMRLRFHHCNAGRWTALTK